MADLAVDKKYDGNQTTSLTSTETSAIIAYSGNLLSNLIVI